MTMRHLRLLALVFLLLCCASVAQAATLTVSSFQVPGYQYGGSTAKLRFYSSISWTDSDGVPHPSGIAGNTTGFFLEVNCTVTGTSLNIPSFTIPSTTDGVPNSARITAVIFDAKGIRRDPPLFSNAMIPSPDPPMSWANPTTWKALNVYWQGQPKPLGQSYATLVQVSQLIAAALPAPKASVVMFGITKLSAPPKDSSNPVARSADDPAVPTFDPLHDPCGVDSILSGIDGEFYGCDHTGANNPSQFLRAKNQLSAANVSGLVYNLATKGGANTCNGIDPDDTAAAQTLAEIATKGGRAKIALPLTVGGKCLLSNNLTIPAGVTVDHTNGMAWLLSDGRTLTYGSAPIAAADQQIVYNFGPGHGNIVMSGSVIHPGWFGAKTNDGVDDWLAIQTSINMGVNSTVQLDAGAYNLSRPLVMNVNDLNLVGAGGRFSTTLIPTFASGPAILLIPSDNEGLRIRTSLVTGTGNAYELGLNRDFALNLSDSRSAELNGRSAFTVEFFYKSLLSTASQAAVLRICSSRGRLFVFDPTASAFSIHLINPNTLQAIMNIGGTTYTITSAANAIVVGTTYHIALTFDGSNMRLFLNGALVGTQAAAGTIVQKTYEDVTIGAATGLYPDTTDEDSYSAAGIIDSPRLSSVARYTSAFTAPTSKLAFDGSTLMLLPFADNQGKVTGVQTSYGDGFLVLRNFQFGLANEEAVRDIRIQGNDLASGIFAFGASNSTFENLTLSNYRIGLHLWNNSFLTVVSSVKLTGTTAPVSRFSASDVMASGIVSWDNVAISNGVHGFIGGEGSMFLNNVSINITQEGEIGALFRGAGSPTQVTLNSFKFSDEGVNSGKLRAGLAFSNVDSAVINGGESEMVATPLSPPVIIDRGGSFLFNNFTMTHGDPTPGYLVNILNPPISPPVFIAPVERKGVGTTLTSNDASVTILRKDNSRLASALGIRGGLSVDENRVVGATMPAVPNATNAGDVITNFNLLLYGLREHGLISAPRLSDIPNLFAQYGAGHITGITNGASLENWADITGHGHTATQTIGASKPVYRAAGINGVPSVEFDGVNDYLNLAGFVDSNPGDETTILATIKTVDNNAGGFFGTHNTNDARYFSVVGDNVRWYSAPTLTATIPNNTATVIAFTLKLVPNRELIYWRDGVKITTATDADTHGLLWIVPTIGAFRPSASPDWFKGQIRDIVIYNRKLTDAEVLKASEILGGTCGIAIP